MPTLHEELIQKAQARISKGLYEDADQTDTLLRALGKKIADECGCLTSFGPIKKRERASEKVKKDYGGDWYDLKDAVRMTIIAPRPTEMKRVGDRIRATCVHSCGMGIIKDTEKFAASDPCGYSDLNFVVRLTNHRPAEIQVNIPVMIYAKEREDDSKNVLGADTFNQLKCKFGIDGGYGHKLYEIYRVAPTSNLGKHAAEVSIEYYGYLRRGFPNRHIVEELNNALKALSSMQPPPLRPRSQAVSGPSGGPMRPRR